MYKEKRYSGLRRWFSEFRLYCCNEWLGEVPSYSIRHFFYKKVMKFDIGHGSSILMHCFFDTTGSFRIGTNSVINQKCRIDNRGGIYIGNEVSISQEVLILTADHDPDAADFKSRCKPVHIDNRVWIGTRAMILPGVSLGEGAVVAAGAVVTKDVAPFTIVAGIPARFIRERNKELSYSISYRRLFQ